MRNIRLKITYEGTRYQGWQKQENSENTIQGKLEQLLGRDFVKINQSCIGKASGIFGAGQFFFDTAFFNGQGTAVLETITYHALALGFTASALKTSKNVSITAIDTL